MADYGQGVGRVGRGKLELCRIRYCVVSAVLICIVGSASWLTPAFGFL